MIDFTASVLSLAELYIIKMKHGVTLRITSSDEPIVWQDNTYVPKPVKRGSLKRTIDFESQVLDITMPSGCITLDGRNLLKMDIDGYFDAAEVSLVFYERITGSYEYMFRGVIAGQSEGDLDERTFKAKDLLYYLEETIPKFVYQRQCNHTLYDYNCRVDKDAFRADAAIDAIYEYDKRIVVSTGLENFGANWFRNGIITVTSGANAGQSRRVMLSSSSKLSNEDFVRYGMSLDNWSLFSAVYILMPTNVGVLYLDKPFWNEFAVGDAFSVWAGCDKSSDTCKNKFNNLINFLGFEYIPESDTALKV